MLLLTLPDVSQAALLSRLGGQAYYDTVLDITWLADANLADSNGFGVAGILTNGEMPWSTANDWIAAMNAAHGTGYLGFDDWRLPTLSPVDGSSTFNTAFSNNGTTDIGYGAIGIGWQTDADDFVSEMGYMFYADLGNLAICAPNGSGSSSSCILQAGFSLFYNTGPFSNLQSDVYWSGLEFAPSPDDAWDFRFYYGRQDAHYGGNNFFAWPVRSGDVVAPVPVPGMVVLMGACLMGLIGVNRSKGRMDAAVI